MKPIITALNEDFSKWTFDDVDGRTINEIQMDAAKLSFEEMHKTMEMELRYLGEQGFVFEVGGQIDIDALAYFSLESIMGEAVVAVADRERSISETRGILRRAKQQLLDAIKVFDAAIENPIRPDGERGFSDDPRDHMDKQLAEELRAECKGVIYEPPQFA